MTYYLLSIIALAALWKAWRILSRTRDVVVSAETLTRLSLVQSDDAPPEPRGRRAPEIKATGPSSSRYTSTPN